MIIGIRGLPQSGKTEVGIMLAYAFNGGNNDILNYLEFKNQFLSSKYTPGVWTIKEFRDSIKTSIMSMYGVYTSNPDDILDEDSEHELYYVLADIGINSPHRKIMKSFHTHDDALEYKMRWENLVTAPLSIYKKDLTWRDIIDTAEIALHNALGEYTFLQSFYDLFQTDANIIVTDVSRSEHVNMIYANGGLIIQVHRNFIIPCTPDEARLALKRHEKVILMDSMASPTQIISSDQIDDLERRQVDVRYAIDCSPKLKLKDNLFNKDVRHDFLIHNSAGDNEDSSLPKLLEAVLEISPKIHSKLVKRNGNN